MLKLKFTSLLVIGFAAFMISSSGGRNGNFAGAPGDQGTGNCSNCHGGGTTDGNISLSNVPTAFSPNTTYNFTITLTDADAAEGGFQIVATQGSGNTPVGTFGVTAGETKINNTNRLVQSTPKSLSGGAVSWNISWTSPATTSSNQIQFFLAGNAVNGNGGTSGDATYTTTTSVLPLPVELITFYAELNEDNEPELVWETASELNNKGFEIEQSLDGKEWKNIGFVEGVGTTLEAQKYTFTVPVINESTTYYRLKQIDYDGAFEYSKAITFEREIAVSEIKIYPNPAIDFIYFENSEVVNIRIININGQTIFQSMGVNQNQLDISILEKGVYFIQIEANDGTQQVEKIIKL